MNIAYITPCKDYLLAELREKASVNLRSIIARTPWLSWKRMYDVNGKGRMQWYIVVDTTIDKEKRLSYFSNILCDKEGYEPSSRLCPHDLYYDDLKYFPGYGR